jgi:hypothetical protein
MEQLGDGLSLIKTKRIDARKCCGLPEMCVMPGQSAVYGQYETNKQKGQLMLQEPEDKRHRCTC